MPDKPAHVIEIPDSLGRDVDAYREGRGEAPPIEAFMSDESLEQVQRQTAAAPVHAEDLVPISQAEAADRTTIRGDTLPRMPVTRPVIPAPFRRPSISISHHGRTWQPCRAGDVQVGDTVPGVGLVTGRQIVTQYADSRRGPGRSHRYEANSHRGRRHRAGIRPGRAGPGPP